MTDAVSTSHTLVISSKLSELSRVEKFSEKICKDAGIDEDVRENIAIAVTEVVNNAIIHGNKKDGAKKVFLEFIIGRKNIVIKVRDEGNGFDPHSLADPLAPENIMKEGGRGIYILRTLMDSVDFEFSPQGTTTILTKSIR
ncbi:ATP-binding protein [candidate division KSB1 bacterium]